MRKSFIPITLVFLLTTASSLWAQPAQPPQPKWMTSPAMKMVDKARATTKQVTIKNLKDAIDAHEKMTILDVRESNEYQVAHIPQSINLPRGLLEFNIWTLVPNKDEKIYVFCKTGARAALATRELNDLGYRNAVAVDTGSVAWVKAGYPVQTLITDEECPVIPAPIKTVP